MASGNSVAVAEAVGSACCDPPAGNVGATGRSVVPPMPVVRSGPSETALPQEPQNMAPAGRCIPQNAQYITNEGEAAVDTPAGCKAPPIDTGGPGNDTASVCRGRMGEPIRTRDLRTGMELPRATASPDLLIRGDGVL